jgi:putative redox protein
MAHSESPEDLSSAAPHGAADDPTVVVDIGAAGLRTTVVARGHQLVADEPVADGGGGEGLTPYDLLAASLGACTAMTLRLYASRKEWPLDGVTVRLQHDRIHARDCESCEDQSVGIDQIRRTVVLRGALTDEQRTRLLQIADRCPVHRTLERRMQIVTEIADA